MNARARETSTVVITALLGKGGGGGTNVHPHKTNEGEKGRGLHTTSIPHTSNIIIHDSAAVTVFGTKSIHPKQT